MIEPTRLSIWQARLQSPECADMVARDDCDGLVAWSNEQGYGTKPRGIIDGPTLIGDLTIPLSRLDALTDDSPTLSGMFSVVQMRKCVDRLLAVKALDPCGGTVTAFLGMAKAYGIIFDPEILSVTTVSASRAEIDITRSASLHDVWIGLGRIDNAI